MFPTLAPPPTGGSDIDRTPAIHYAFTGVRLHFTPTYASWLNLVEMFFFVRQ